MSLPKIASYPTKVIKLPLSGKETKVRPFLVKEEKILLMSKESENLKDLSEAVVNAIESCCLTPVEVKKLPLPDVEHLFNQIRAFSKGETINPAYRCKAPKKDDPSAICGTVVKHEIDLSKLEIDIPKNHTNKLDVPNSNFVVVMKYPTFESTDAAKITEDATEIEIYETVLDLVECVVDKKSGDVFDSFTREELREFMDSMTKAFFDSVIERFFNSMPALAYTLKFECPVCGNKQDIPFRGLADFFASVSPRSQSGPTTSQTTK